MMINRLGIFFIFCFSALPAFGMEIDEEINPNQTMSIAIGRTKTADLYFAQKDKRDAVRVVFNRDGEPCGTKLYTSLPRSAWKGGIDKARIVTQIKQDGADAKYDTYAQKKLAGCYAIIDGSSLHEDYDREVIKIENDASRGANASYLVLKKVVLSPEDNDEYLVRCYMDGSTRVFNLPYDEKPGTVQIHKDLMVEIEGGGFQPLPDIEEVVGLEGKQEITDKNQNSVSWGSFFKYAFPTAAIIGVGLIIYKWFKNKKEKKDTHKKLINRLLTVK